MLKVRKDGITKFIPENEYQKYKDWGYVKLEEKLHKPEPMVIKEEEPKTKTKKAE